MEVFGPVPSRRLGRSLGINLIPPKICSYSCRYCQLGNTLNMRTKRGDFYDPQEALLMVENKMEEVQLSGTKVDYMAFVPDGEPTLDLHLGEMASYLKKFDIPLAIITNASIITEKSVQEELKLFDWVSLKVDGVTEEVWRYVDRPHSTLDLPSILNGIKDFSSTYTGHLETETMLVAGGNDSPDHLAELASYLQGVNPSICRLSSPTRPPAYSDVKCVGEDVLIMATDLFQKRELNVKILNAYEGNDFTKTGDTESSLLSILSVHPMTDEAVKLFLSDSPDGESVLKKGLETENILCKTWQDKTFYVRNLRQTQNS